VLRVFDSNGRCHGKGKLCLTAIALMFDRVRAHHTSAAYVRISEPVALFLMVLCALHSYALRTGG
jgi:hypothetical protein